MSSLRTGSAPKLIIHYDRGFYYRCLDWIKRVADADLTRTTSGKGGSLDNSASEGSVGQLGYGRV